MNEFVSTAAISLRKIISAFLATLVWPHAWCGLADFKLSIDFIREDTDAVLYFVNTHKNNVIYLPCNQHIMYAL